MFLTGLYYWEGVKIVIEKIKEGNLKFNSDGKWKRYFFIYRTKVGVPRGGHAHKECVQGLICVSGDVSIKAYDGKTTSTFDLNENDDLCFVVFPGIWLDIDFLSEDSRLLVLASHKYDESDYLRNKSDYQSWLNSTI